MEALVKSAIQQFCEENNILQDFQHGFRRGRSCLSNLLACLDIWTRALEEGFEVDVVHIDFRKSFDTVPHQRLLHKLSAIGIRGDLLNWTRAYLVGRKQRVCIGENMSEWVNVTSGVPQCSVLGPLLFILYVNDSLQELDCGKIMFADDVKLWQVIKGPNDQRPRQDNLHRLQAWSKKWLLDFNVEKCAVLHLRPTNSHSNDSLRTYHLKDIRLPAESSQKDLGSAIERQKICEEEVKVDIVQKSRQIEVEQNEVLLRSCVLASTVKEPALAEAFQISALAEGKKQATILAAQASADAIRLVGAAKASVVQALGEAEAEGLRLKAEAFAEFSQAAKLRLILDCLPSVAAEVCAPLAKTSEIVVLGGEARKSAVPPTVASLSEDLVRVTGTLPHAVRALSGVDLSKCIGRIPGATTVANS
nr:unnamed protein product [Spirometra erinaceieuropaei]